MGSETKLKKVLDEIKRVSPNKIDREDLCLNANISPYELAYLIRAFPSCFEPVNIIMEKDNVFFTLNYEKLLA